MIEIEEDYIDHFLNNENTILILQASREGEVLYPIYDSVRLNNICSNCRISEEPLYQRLVTSNNRIIFVLKSGLYNEFLSNIALYQAIQDSKELILHNESKLIMKCHDILGLWHWKDVEEAFNNKIEFILET